VNILANLDIMLVLFHKRVTVRLICFETAYRRVMIKNLLLYIYAAMA